MSYLSVAVAAHISSVVSAFRHVCGVLDLLLAVMLFAVEGLETCSRSGCLPLVHR